jgi:hypothetical protein
LVTISDLRTAIENLDFALQLEKVCMMFRRTSLRAGNDGGRPAPRPAEALGLIRELFAVEQQAREIPCADRLALQQVQSLPVVQRLHGKLLEWKQQLLPKHPIAEAIGYVLNQWQPLRAFLSDGAIPIHNNLTEQQMKRVALELPVRRQPAWRPDCCDSQFVHQHLQTPRD